MKVIIIGAGKLGYQLAEALIRIDIEVTLIDSNNQAIERVSDHLDVLAICANGLELDTLRSLSVESYDLLIATTSSDESNAMICTMAKKLGCGKTIARIRNPEYSMQLDFIKAEMGIDHIVNPDLATANEITRYLVKNYYFYSGDYAKGKVQMVDIKINFLKSFIGKKVMEINGIEGVLIVAVSRDGQVIIPNGYTELLEDDVIYLVGKSNSIEKIAQRFELNVKEKSIEKVMILGGGKIGYYLAKNLSESAIKVTIIEQSLDRCEYLTSKLENPLIIYGDGTDINLLEEEGLSEMDAFIGATGFDEQNLLMSLMAKQAGVSKVISKVSRLSYISLIDKLGIDVALNPVSITASDILKYIRGGRIISVSLLLGGQAEVTELIVAKGVLALGKQIVDLGLPKGIMIGSIVRDSKVIIPTGKTIIKENDRLVIFCLVDDVHALDIFLKARKGGKWRALWSGS